MLFSLAPIASSSERGIVMLLQKHWTSSSAIQAESIFTGFADSFFRLRGDKEATKPYLGKYGFPMVSDLESASEICKRKLPERLRKECFLYFIVQDLHAQKLRLHFKLPAWADLSFLDSHSAIFQMQLQHSQYEDWSSADTSTDSEFAGDWAEPYLNFFGKIQSKDIALLEPIELEGPQHFRLAELILRSQNSFLRPTFSVSLKSP
jgi:hypothetical protein